MTTPTPVNETARALQTLLLAHLDENAPRDVIDTVIEYSGDQARHLCIVLIGMWGDLLLTSHGGDRRAALKQVYGMCGTAAETLDSQMDAVPVAPRKKQAAPGPLSRGPKAAQKPPAKKAQATKKKSTKR